jgi:integrase
VAIKLTDKAVRALERPAAGNRIVYDDTVRGFGARITAAGAIAFVLNYRVKATGAERRHTLGSFPSWSVAEARQKARELKRRVDDGGDPLGELATERSAPTVAELCQRFREQHVVKLRLHTRRDYEAIIRNDILPALGRIKVARLEFEHIERLHAKMTARAPVRANRGLALLSTMLALAVRWRLRPDNPAKGVQRNREHQRKRYLSSRELSHLMEALAQYHNRPAADAIRMLLLTGARKAEILAARFEQFQDDVWVKPHGLTKQAREHRVPLSAPVRQLLDRLRKDATTPWLFPGRGGGHLNDLKEHWPAICRAAGIDGLRVHDLRHSHASMLVSAGFSLPVIGAMLGHTQPSTTARYAHLLDDPLKKAAEAVGRIVSGQPPAEVVPLKRGRRR